MTTETYLQRAGEILAPFAKGTNNPETNRLDVQISASDLPAAASALTNASWGYLAPIIRQEEAGWVRRSEDGYTQHLAQFALEERRNRDRLTDRWNLGAPLAR